MYDVELDVNRRDDHDASADGLYARYRESNDTLGRVHETDREPDPERASVSDDGGSARGADTVGAEKGEHPTALHARIWKA